MKQEHKITITKSDFFKLLSDQGVRFPENAFVNVKNGTEEWASMVDFPIVLTWEENQYTPGRVYMQFALDAVMPFDVQKVMYQNRYKDGQYNRIAAIKKMREVTGWGLKECKDWLDHNFPRE